MTPTEGESVMDWFKTTSSFWMHPKVAGLTDRQFRVLVSAWGYAAQHNTSGHVNDSALRIIGGRPSDAKALTEADLWHQVPGGWVIHDWDDHQAAAAAIHDRRARDRARKTAARVRGSSTDIPRSTSGGSSAEVPRRGSAENPPLEENRREENTPLPPSDTSEGVREGEHRRERHQQGLTPDQLTAIATAATVNGRITNQAVTT